MGGRGTFAAGKQVAYTYETVGKVDGVKIINPIDKSKSLKLPEESHSSVGYVLYDKDGVFHQYRKNNLLYYASFYFYLRHMPVI